VAILEDEDARRQAPVSIAQDALRAFALRRERSPGAASRRPSIATGVTRFAEEMIREIDRSSRSLM
jgi:hypothetical protein